MEVFLVLRTDKLLASFLAYQATTATMPPATVRFKRWQVTSS